MNFDNNHFIDAGQHISGYLYGLKPNHDSRYAGKGSKQPSTYSEEVYGYGWSSANQHPSTQRSNGYVAGSGKPVASGILLGAMEGISSKDGKSWRAEPCELVWVEAEQVFRNVKYLNEPSCPFMGGEEGEEEG